MVIRVLGLDVGSTHTGLALLHVPPTGKAILEGRGWLDLAGTLAALDREAPELALVAIEPPTQVHPGIARARGPQAAISVGNAVAAAREIVGQIKGRCDALGLRWVEVPASEWRAALCGRSNADNARVKLALSMRIEWGGPTNDHVRDAAGCGLAAVLRDRACRLTKTTKPVRGALCGIPTKPISGGTTTVRERPRSA